MTSGLGELKAAVRAYRRAKKVADERYSLLTRLIIAASDNGERQVDIVNATGYTRERIRQILKAEADRRRSKPGHDANPED